MLSRLLVSMALCAFAFLIRVVAIYLLAVHESDFEGVLQSFLLDALLYYIPEVVPCSVFLYLMRNPDSREQLDDESAVSTVDEYSSLSHGSSVDLYRSSASRISVT